MGACLSVAPHPRGATLAEIEGELDTGDIVLLLDGSKSSKYLFKAGGAGGWAQATKIGFLVRSGPGPEGLTFYHSDECAGVEHPAGMSRVACKSLDEELRCGHYRLAVVRRLYKRLTPEKAALVQEFVTLNLGSVVANEENSSVLMASTGSSTTTAFERLSCSDFVAMMLHLVGLVEPTTSHQEFVATDKKGRLMGPPLAIKTRAHHSILTERRSSNLSEGDPVTPMSTEQSMRSHQFPDSTDRCAVGLAPGTPDLAVHALPPAETPPLAAQLVELRA